MAVAKAKKLRVTIQEGSKNEESLTTACEQLHSAVESAAVEVCGDENISKESEAVLFNIPGSLNRRIDKEAKREAEEEEENKKRFYSRGNSEKVKQ